MKKTAKIIRLAFLFIATLFLAKETISQTNINYGETITETISVNGEVDVYTFIGNPGDKVVVRMTESYSGSSENMEPYIRLYEPTGVLVSENEDNGQAKIFVTLTSSGNYSIFASDLNGDDTGDYGIFLQRTFEPGTADTVNYGETVAANISTYGDIDTYMFSGNEGDKVVVRMTQGYSGYSENAEPYIEVYTPSGELLADTVDVDQAKLFITLPDDGNYTVLASDSYPGEQPGDYGFFLQRTFEPGTADTVNYGETVAANISTYGDIDTYMFSGNEGDKVVVRMTQGYSGYSENAEPYIEVYTPSGELLADTVDVDQAKLFITLPDDGNYTVLASDSYPGEQPGDYGFFLQRTFEPGLVESLEFGQTVVSNISTYGDIDTYSFFGYIYDTVFVQVTEFSGSTSLEPYIELFDPIGDTIISNWNNSQASLGYKLQSTGEHTILVSDYYPGDDQGDYSIFLYGFEAPKNHNVGVSEIISPDNILTIDSSVFPKAVILNTGLNAETFPVNFTIGDIYSDEVVLTLQPDEIDTVVFSNWIAQPPGTYTTKCKTLLPEDEYPPNDSIIGVVTVSSGIGPDIYSITPNHGGNTGSVTVEITGYGFEEGATVKLTRSGQEDIVADSNFTFVNDSSKIETIFNLLDAEIGYWDLSVVNPDNNEGIFYNGFEVEQGFLNLYVDLIGVNTITVGTIKHYYLSIKNLGNVNIDELFTVISSNQNGILHYTEKLFLWDITLQDTIPNDTIGFVCYNIPPNKTLLSSFKIEALSGGQITIQSESKIFQSTNSKSPYVFEPSTNNCAINIKDAKDFPPTPPPEGSIVFQGSYIYSIPSSPLQTGHVGVLIYLNGEPYVWESLNPGGTGFTSWYDFCLRTYPLYPAPYWELHGFWDYHNPNLTAEEINQLREWCNNNTLPYSLDQKCTEAIVNAFSEGIGKDLFPGYEECITDSPAKYYKLLKKKFWPSLPFINTPNFWWLVGEMANPFIDEACDNSSYDNNEEKNIQSVQSWDPNDKAGPFGYGEGHYIRPMEPMYYIIQFENVDSATAAAQYIKLSDTLNTNLDWNTLVFDSTSHTVASQTFDPSTGIIEWEFEGINLPPNVTPPEGEGWVMFHIDQLPDLPSGTEITNQASIKFDYNDPMLTGTVLNTIDAGYPSSSMISTYTHLDSTNYLVSWTGQDDLFGSGIKDYTIYYSEHPDSVYIEWLRNTEDTSAVFTGEYEKTYYFYSIARDGVGYIESPPDAYDLALYVNLGIEANDLLNSNLIKIYPNPFSDRTTIEFNNPNQSSYDLSIFSITGNKVLKIENIKSNKVEIEKGNLLKGIYLVELKGEQVFNNKMIIIK